MKQVKLKSSNPTRKDAILVYEWCMKKYGRSKVNGTYPELLFHKGNYLNETLYGEYEWIEHFIFVNKDKNKQLIDLIDTLIHEWIHYLQPIKSHYRRTVKEKKLHTFLEDNDPLEKEARRIAKRDRDKCFKELYKK